MKKKNLYLSTIDEHAQDLAKQYRLGLEIAEYGTAWNMDEQFAQTDAVVRPKMTCTDRFTLHGPYSELFPCAVDPKVRAVAADRFRQAIALAENYGIHKIIFHGGFNPWLYFPCWYKEQCEIFWKKFVDDIPDDMVVCVENVLEETPDMLGDVLRAVDSPKLRMCLDVGHAHAYSKNTPMEWLESCKDLIAHFHVHNNDSSWDTHSPLDCGTIPMKQLLAAIDKNCPDASITLELMDAASSVEWLLKNEILEESI